jgi:hypothetical protein
MGSAVISFGPKLGLLNNATIGEAYYDQFRPFLRGVDALVQANVISYLSSPPGSPSDGDSYIIQSGTGAWTGLSNQLAVYSAQITQTGTNTLTPGWDYYIPDAGWIVFIVGTGFVYFNGTVWGPLISGGTANYTQPPVTLPAPDGSTSYALGFTPSTPAASFYFVNGIKRVYDTYYTITGSNLEILDDNPPDVANGDTSHELYAS